MKSFDWLFLWIPAVLVAVSIPMLLGMVPPNGLYGFRTRASMADPAIWYASNRAAAVYLILAAALSIGVYLLLKHTVSSLHTQVLIGSVVLSVLVLASAAAAQVQTLKWTKQGGPPASLRGGRS